MKVNHRIFGIVLVFLLSGCFGTRPVVEDHAPQTYESVEVQTEPTPRLQSSVEQAEGFPYLPQLSLLLPQEGLVLAMHVYGEGVCYDVGIYQDETYNVISCLNGFEYPAPTGSIDQYESYSFHRWLDRNQGYQTPSAHGVLIFNGSGSFQTDLLEQYSMEALLTALEYRAHSYVSGGGMPNAVLVSKNYLAGATGVVSEAVTVLGFESVEYSDSCLELPRAGEECIPQITMGLLIKLISNDLLYEFHADFAGYDIRPVGDPVPAPASLSG